MTKLITFIIANILFISGLSAQISTPDKIENQSARLLKNNKDGEALASLSSLLLNKSDYEQSIYYAKLLEELGIEENNEYYVMRAASYLGQAYIMTSEPLLAKGYLERGKELAQKYNDDNVLCSVYNGLGLYALNMESDYYSSINYFFEGIEIAKRCSNDRLYSIMLCNLCGVYYLKNDPEGLKYSIECYELGHSMSDPFLIYCGSTNTSYMYYLLGDYEEALNYIKEAEFIMLSNDYYDQSNIYALFGKILAELGNDTEAIDYFKKSLLYSDVSNAASIANTYLGYGKVMIKQRDYREAIRFFSQGIAISLERGSSIWLSELYEELSEAHEILNEYDDALTYRKIHKVYSDSLFNMDKERSLRELRVKYDTEKYENDLIQNRLLLSQKDKNLYLMYFILILTLLFIGAMFIYYRHKNKLFGRIVLQNQEAIRKEKLLETQIEGLRAKMSEGDDRQMQDKYAVSSLSEDKSRNLYEKLEELMSSRKVYHENDFTKERLATLLGTNRTYLSQVINEPSGKSFTNYINTYRIEDAIRILSDPLNDIPLKALASELGFNSITTFYSLFKNSSDMTPSQYRSKVQELARKSKHVS